MKESAYGPSVIIKREPSPETKAKAATVLRRVLDSIPKWSRILGGRE